MKVAVVGSGPSGVAATATLLEHGHAVDVLDVGHAREPGSHALAAEVRAAVERGERPGRALYRRRSSRGCACGSASPPRCRAACGALRGTRRASRRAPRGAPLESGTVMRSLARGGLSNAWGAARYPWRASDLAGPGCDRRLTWLLVALGLAFYTAGYAAFYPRGVTNDDEGLYVEQTRLWVETGSVDTQKIDPFTGERTTLRAGDYPLGMVTLIAPFVAALGWRGAFFASHLDAVLAAREHSLREFMDDLSRPYDTLHRTEVTPEQLDALRERYGRVFVALLDRSGSAHWRGDAARNAAFVASLGSPEPVVDLRVTSTDRLRIWRIDAEPR